MPCKIVIAPETAALFSVRSHTVSEQAFAACPVFLFMKKYAGRVFKCNNNFLVVPMYKKISPEEAKKMMDEKPCLVLDVRTEDEFVLGHIENSVCIPVDDLDGRLDELPDKDRTILVCCRSGRSSALAAEYLDRAGYKNVYDFGGLVYWRYGYVEWD